MKKNLLSVLILALLVVNIVLTVIMMVSILGMNKSTGELVRSVAAAMNLQLYEPGSENTADVPLSQTATYNISQLIIQLKHNEDGSGENMIIFDMSLSMNMEHKDYEKMGTAETMANFEIQIRDAVESVVRQYTSDECGNPDVFDGQIRTEILAAIQKLFQSDFIYRVSVSGVMFQ